MASNKDRRDRIRGALPHDLETKNITFEDNAYLSMVFLRTDEPSQYDVLREIVLEIEDKAGVLFDYFLDNREWQVFFALRPEESQLAKLHQIVRISEWLLKHGSEMEREAKNFEWKRIDEMLDEVVRHPELYTETFRALRTNRELRDQLVALASSS